MSIYDTIVGLIKTELQKTAHGRKTLAGWSDSKIKMELKDPCFFGAKPEMRDKVKAVKHFQRIAEINNPANKRA
ncbi:hypothetical protein D3C76_429850 [compost metagenome]